MKNLRERLIHTIARCGHKETRSKWIIELSKSDIECSESQCDGCPIVSECVETLDSYYTGAVCLDNCNIDEEERCADCIFK